MNFNNVLVGYTNNQVTEIKKCRYISLHIFVFKLINVYDLYIYDLYTFSSPLPFQMGKSI